MVREVIDHKKVSGQLRKDIFSMCYDNEGVKYKEPQLKIMGIEGLSSQVHQHLVVKN